MLKHNIKIAFRNAMRHLNYTFLNVFGLTLGLTSFILIMLYVTDEIKYDKFHENADVIYRVNRLYNSNDINEDAATCSFPFAPALEDAYPHLVAGTCRFFDFQRSKMLLEYRISEEESIKFNEEWMYLADSNVFKIFTFPMIEGDPETALVRPNTIVLTESTAKRYFGDEKALGKTLRIEEVADLEVTGVMKDLPPQSHMTIDLLVSLATFREIIGGQLPQTWIWNPCWTYIELAENVKPEQLEAQFGQFYLDHYADFQDQEIKLYLQNIQDIHLHSRHEYEMQPNGNATYIKVLTMIAVFVLILAVINFMNLATANSAGRAKEIGLKKVLGAHRSGLRAQFLTEALVQTFFAMLLAMIAVEIILPYFNNFTGKEIQRGLVLNPLNILLGITLVVVVGILSGSYPAFYLSSLSTGKFRGEVLRAAKSGLARKILVVVQFFISIALIIGAITAYNQLNYMQNAELGYNKDQIIVVPSVDPVSMRFDAFSEELKQNNHILHVTGMEDVLGVNHNTRQMFIEGFGEEEFYYYPTFMVRDEFLDVFDIQVVEGRGFSRDFPADTMYSIMINESMVKDLGWTNESAIGKRFRSDGQEQVIGVFKDFHAMSLHKPVTNFILDMLANPRAAAGLTRYIAIRVNTDNYDQVISHIKDTWQAFAPTRPFEYFFFDEKLDEMYKDEQKLSSISIIITIIAIMIAALGLIGLTSFMVEQRTKEICVRRVHGATFQHVNALLSKEFLRLISVAILLSWPIAYYGLNAWFQNFSQHIALQWLVFIVSGFVAVVMVLTITSLHANKAVSVNPADVLKFE